MIFLCTDKFFTIFLIIQTQNFFSLIPRHGKENWIHPWGFLMFRFWKLTLSVIYAMPMTICVVYHSSYISFPLFLLAVINIRFNFFDLLMLFIVANIKNGKMKSLIQLEPITCKLIDINHLTPPPPLNQSINQSSRHNIMQINICLEFI